MLLLRGVMLAGGFGRRTRTMLRQFQSCSYYTHTIKPTSSSARTLSKLLLVSEYRTKNDNFVRSISGSPVLSMAKVTFETLVPGSKFPEQSTKIRLEGLDNKSLGETTAGLAVQMAIKNQCKVVLVENDKTDKPLCRLMTGKKFAEEEAKLRKLSHGKKPAKTHQLHIGSKITDHDLRIKVAHTRQLLRKGSPIVVTIKNASRDGTDMGMTAVFEKIIEACKEDSTVEKVNKSSQAIWTFILTPLPEVQPITASANQ